MKRLALFALLASPAWGQFAVDEMFRPLVYTNETGETFAYRMSAPQFPEPGRRYPLILFLHGSGECGTDNRRQLTVGVPALMRTLMTVPEPVVVIAPQCQPANWWVRGLAFNERYSMPHEPSGAMEVALDLCRAAVASGLADSNRLYVTGLSLGGFGTWDAVQREPELFAAALPICGGGDVRRVSPLRGLPIWVFHGRADKNVPVDCSRRMVSALRVAGSSAVRYTEYENGEHMIWDRVYGDREAVVWLLSQRRNAKVPWWKIW